VNQRLMEEFQDYKVQATNIFFRYFHERKYHYVIVYVIFEVGTVPTISKLNLVNFQNLHKLHEYKSILSILFELFLAISFKLNYLYLLLIYFFFFEKDYSYKKILI